MSTRFTKLSGIQYNYDCPNPNCDGWLTTFAKTGDSKPCFLRCVNSSKNENGSCTVSTIFSSKDGKCLACNNKIKKVFVNLLYKIMYTNMRFPILHQPKLYFSTKKSTLH